MLKKVIYCSCLALGIMSVATPARAQLKYGTDYTTSDAVWNVTVVKVDSNMIPDYLEGIKQTWMASMDVAKQLGQAEDYSVYVSELPAGGDFNLILTVKFTNMEQYEKGHKEFKEFEDAWRKKLSEEKEQAIVKTYPNMRTIVGEYLFRHVDFVK